MTDFPLSSMTLVVPTAGAMHAVGARLGAALDTGDVLALTGPLGSGKTTLCQGLAAGLGVPASRQVASPTFSLVNLHPGRVPFAHADLYRLKSEAELEELGLEEAMEEGVTAIEWAERFPSLLPPDHLSLQLFIEPDGARTLVLGAQGPRSAGLLALFRGEEEAPLV